MIIKNANTYWANIYVGLQEGYDGETHTIQEAMTIVKQYCDEVGYCVTVTPTTFVYRNGIEPGCIVGLINYPRFPVPITVTLQHAKNIAKLFLEKFNQNRISVVSPAHTFMVEKE